MKLSPLYLCLTATLINASVTVYNQIPLALQTSSAAGSTTTGTSAANSKKTLIPPAIVAGAVPLTPFVQLQTTADLVPGISIPHSGTFYGFSIEMSVLNQVVGSSPAHINVPFLNLLGQVQKRAGSVRIRVGGNTQEIAYFVDELPDGVVISKDKPAGALSTTQTPAVIYTAELFYMLSNVSSLVNAKWYTGIPFNQTLQSGGFRLKIAELSQTILGDNLLAMQAGNEPDLYTTSSQHRVEPYLPTDFSGEFGDLITAIAADASIPNKGDLLGPNIAKDAWLANIPDFITQHGASLAAITVEHYPDDNCNAAFGTDHTLDKVPQDLFASYLTHSAGVELVAPYRDTANLAVASSKPFIMFETNTASCGGFPGISDSFASSLWALDYGFQMGSANFSGALLHVGGQNVYYNPFTAAPTNETYFHQWTVGPIFYAVIVTAEAYGTSNTSRIVDMTPNNWTSAYAIYENNVPARLALFNYLDDASGANDVTFSFAIGGSGVGQANGTPSTVKVKYLDSPSVSEQHNITWAGQTFGGAFEADGRLKGDLDIVSITCNSDNTCTVPLKAPQFALVFLTDEALSETASDTDALTFATTAVTNLKNTATIASEVLATSNGMNGATRKLGGTSKSETSSGATSTRDRASGIAVSVCLASGMMFVWSVLGR